MKKGFIAMLVFTVFFALSLGFGDTADAKRGGIKSGKSSYTQKKDSATKTDTTQKSSSGATTNKSNTANTTGKTSSGGFLKGMLVGGIAGMLFGSMFAGMGAFGDILAVLMNIIIMVGILALVMMLISKVWRMFKPATAGSYNNRNNVYQRRDEEDDRNKRGQF